MKIALRPRTLAEEFGLVGQLSLRLGLPIAALYLLVSLPDLMAELAGAEAGLVSLLLLFVWPLVTGVVTARVAGVFAGDTVDYRRAFRAAAMAYMPLLLWQFLAAIVLGFGLLLLVIPGLLWYARLSLVAPDLVMEQNGLGRGLNRASTLIRGAWIRVTVLVSTWAVMILAIQLTAMALRPYQGGAADAYWIWATYGLDAALSVPMTIAPVVAYYSRRCEVENLDLGELASLVDAIGTRRAGRARAAGRVRG